MQENFAPKKPKNLWKVKVLAASVPLMGIVASASAATLDINATVGPILGSVADLIPSIIALVIAVVPAVIVMACVSFVIGFLGNILQMLKIK